MTMIAPVIVATFAFFKRPLKYTREGMGAKTVGGVVSEARYDPALVGDIGQTMSTVIMTVEDLTALGLYPPLKYDRITYHGHSHAIEDFVINYDGETAVFVRARCLG